MGIVFSDALVAARTSSDEDFPIFCWDNQVTSANIEADEEDSEFPAVNLANPATNLLWKSGSTADQYITVTLDGDDPTDYVAIARHNLGSGLCVVSVEGITDDVGAVWTELVDDALLGDDGPAIFLFDAGYYVGIRLKLQPGSVEPQMAVVSVGSKLTMERGVQPGHVPVPYARSVEAIGGRAPSGDYLGTIITRQILSTSVTFRALSPDWVRSSLQPFLDVFHSPFFFAWWPVTYSTEVGYAWGTNDPQPSPQMAGHIDITMDMSAVSA